MVTHDSEVAVVMETRLVTKAGHRVRTEWWGDREMHGKQHKHPKRWSGRAKEKGRTAKDGGWAGEMKATSAVMKNKR